MIQHAPLVVKNTIRNRRRTILTLASIATSLCLLGTLMALYRSVFYSGTPEQQAHRLIVRNKISLANPLQVSYLPLIRKVAGVEEATIYQFFAGSYKDDTPSESFARFAVEPERLFRIFPEFRLSEEEKKAFLNERTGAIVGVKTARALSMKLGDRVTLRGDIFPVNMDLIIRGIFQAGTADDESMYFHYDYLNESLAPAERASVGAFIVRMDGPESASAVIKDIDDQFRNAPLQTKTETEKAFQLSFLAMLGNVKAFLLSICAAVTFTILLVTGNTMAMAVRERAQEVGVLKTLGFTPTIILGLLVCEALVISFTGGLLGLGLAAVACATLRNGPSFGADLSQLAVAPSIVAVGLGVSLVIGFISSLIPAYTASRRPILESLRVNN
ncbi:MAG: FtsX-like permease family protein [Bryobacterales bacterium]|nr:FtsX-like permease family protein [Bryobacterales bacterium]